VNSAYTQSIFEKHLSSDVPVNILYPTIPDRSIDRTAQRDQSTTNFLSINRFERKKDLALALRAFARLRTLLEPTSRPIHLNVIGGYDPRLRENLDYFNELEQLADELQLDSTLVTFVRSFSDQEKSEYLSNAHCVLYTPRFEHFGIVPLEAMQAARPVIATATGGPLETIVNDRTGFLCDEPLVDTFADRMKQFVEKPDLSQRMGDEGQRHVQQCFSFQAFARQLNEHIDELLKRSVLVDTNAVSRPMLVVCLLLSLFIGWLFF
jgi:alpha-1,3/alpha-1,6-mannosyltransferase